MVGAVLLVRVSVIVPLSCALEALIVIELPETVPVNVETPRRPIDPLNVDPDTDPATGAEKLKLPTGVQS